MTMKRKIISAVPAPASRVTLAPAAPLALFALFTLLAMLTLLTCLVPTRAFSFEVEMRESRNVGLIRFIYSITGVGRASNTMKQIWIETRKDDAEDREFIARFKRVFATLPEEIAVSNSERTRGTKTDARKTNNTKASVRTADALYELAAKTRTLDEFETSLDKTFGENKGEALSACLDHFSTVYERLYWSPSKEGLYKLIEKRRLSGKKYLEILELARTFINPDETIDTLEIIVVPIFVPKEAFAKYKSSGLFSIEGESLPSLQIVETVIPPEQESEFEWAISVHEIVHYFQRVSTAWRGFLEGMEKSDPVFGPLASRYAGEVTATCLQIRAVKTAGDEKVFETGYYDDPLIDALSRIMYPLVEPYLLKGKTADTQLASRLIHELKNKFPDAPLMTEVVLNTLEIFPGSFDQKKLLQLFKDSTPVRRIELVEKKEMRSGENKIESTGTLVYVTKRGNIGSLRKVRAVDYHELTYAAKMNREFCLFSVRPNSSTQSLVFVCEDLNSVQKLTRKIAASKKIEKLTLLE
jgi:hypothetical protein